MKRIVILVAVLALTGCAKQQIDELFQRVAALEEQSLDGDLENVGAGLGISTWTELAETPASGDIMALTDVSDTSGSSSGTSKRVYHKYVIKPRVVNKSTATTLTDDEMDGVVFVSAAVKTDLPAVEIGQTVCFYSTGTNTIIIDPNSNDGIILEGASRLTDGNTIENTSAAAGDFVCLIGDSAAGWTTLGINGTWADGGAT